MREFLDLVLPASGYKVLDYPTESNQGRFFRHKFFTDLDELSASATNLAFHKHDVYHACASFVEPKSRKGSNAAFVKSFWVDLDVGEGQDKYETQEAAAVAIIKFSAEVGLPEPTLVSSGYGIHAYYALTDEIPAQEWLRIAPGFKILLSQKGVKQDTTRTADVASILRTPGTINFKNGSERPVSVLMLGAPVPFAQFTQIVSKGAPVAPPASLPAGSPPAGAFTANDSFSNVYQHVPTDANKVADNCPQIAAMRQTRGNMPEPVWYAAINVVRFCDNSNPIIHEWSSGYPGYSESETNRKIAHASESTTGPTTCVKFEALNPAGCLNCPHKGKITTPLQVGRATVKSADIQFAEDTILKAPAPFFIDDRGRVGLNVDDKAEYISPYPFYFKARFWSVAEKEFCYSLRYWYPQDGWKDAVITSFQLGVFNEFVKAVSRIDLRLENMSMAFKFLNSYADQLKALVATQQMVNRQGWHDTGFVLGERLYQHDGSTADVTLAPSIIDYKDAFKSKGSLELWRLAVAPFAESTEHAFGILAGFAAPLMRFTSYEGAVVNLVGETGSGKSTVQQIVASIYGDYRALDMKHADTPMSKFRKLGVFSSLPATIDEITNVHPEELSTFIYQVSQGRERNRLKSDGAERNNPFTWQTIVISSSNKSIYETLSTFRDNTLAESIRALEIITNRTSSLTREVVDAARMVTRSNYGVVGPEWIKYLVANQTRIEHAVHNKQEYIFKLLGAKTEHRYWLAVISCVLVAAEELNKLELFSVNVPAMEHWLQGMFSSMEYRVSQFTTDANDILAAFVNENLRNRLVFDGNADRRSKQFKPPVAVPDRELAIRVELVNNVMFISKKVFIDWLNKNNISPLSTIKDLLDDKVFSSTERVNIGSGWSTSVPATMCYVVNLQHKLFQESGMLKAVGAENEFAKAASM